MNNNENNLNYVPEEEGVSLGKICQVIFHRYPLLIGITAGITLVGALGIQFVYNRSSVNYTSSFNYNVPSYDGKTLMDGTSFTYQDLTKISTLEKVKSSNSEFSTIDIDKMSENSLISIEFVQNYDSDMKEVTSSYYTLNIRAKLFSDSKLAKKFFTSLVEYPLTYNLSVQPGLNYTVNLNEFNKVNAYEDQISAIKNQYQYIKNKYTELKTSYGDITFVNETASGEKISDVVADIDEYFSDNPISVLEYELKDQGYVMNSTEMEALLATRYNCSQDIKYNKQKIDELQKKVDALLASGSTTISYELDSYNTAISTLIQTNVDLQRQIDYINIKLHVDDTHPDGIINTAPEAFTTKLSNYYTYLLITTSEYKTNEKEAMTNYSTVQYNETGVIKSTGGLNTVMTIVVPVLVGFVVGAIVNLIIDRKYLHEDYPVKEKKTK